MIQGDKNMGEDREGRAAALLPILIFLLIFLGSGFITGDFYSMPAIVAFLIALLAALVQNRELGFSETGNLGGHHHSLAPIAAGISQKTGFSMAVCAGAVVGGAMFGDNLSMISDIQTQKISKPFSESSGFTGHTKQKRFGYFLI